MKFIANFLKFSRELKRSCWLNSWKPFILEEAISFRGKLSFQLKTIFFLGETIPFSGSHSFQQKPIFFSGNHSFQWKLFFIMKGIPFSGNHSFQQKPFIFMETFAPSGRHCFQWKPLLLVEDIPFSGSHFLSQNLIVLVKTAFFTSLETISFRGNHWHLVKVIPFSENCSF